MVKIGFIGTGNMGSALIEAIYDSEDIIAYNPSKGKLNELEKKFDIKKAASNVEVVNSAEMVFLAVKPFKVEEVLQEVKNSAKGKLFISIAAGVKLNILENILPEARFVRVMPNTACFVQEMAAGYALGKNVNERDSKLVKKILGLAGAAFEVEEEKLDAVTGLSGSGPAFVAYLIGLFVEAGRKVGLSEEISRELSIQTFLGTAKLIKEKGISEEELIEMVMTKGGTTEAGMKVLQGSDVDNVIVKVVGEATKRSKELGKK